jgi:hypothetical protein
MYGTMKYTVFGMLQIKLTQFTIQNKEIQQ